MIFLDVVELEGNGGLLLTRITSLLFVEKSDGECLIKSCTFGVLISLVSFKLRRRTGFLRILLKS